MTNYYVLSVAVLSVALLSPELWYFLLLFHVWNIYLIYRSRNAKINLIKRADTRNLVQTGKKLLPQRLHMDGGSKFNGGCTSENFCGVPSAIIRHIHTHPLIQRGGIQSSSHPSSIANKLSSSSNWEPSQVPLWPGLQGPWRCLITTDFHLAKPHRPSPKALRELGCTNLKAPKNKPQVSE